MKLLFLIVLFIFVLLIRYKIKNKRRYNKICKLFYSTNDFPKIKIIDLNWRIISQETKKLSNNIIANIDINFLKNKQNILYLINLLNDNYGWLNITQGNFNNYNYLYWPLIYQGKIILKNCSFCINTCILLSKLNGIKYAGFSILKSNSYTYPIKYNSNTKYYIGLNISDKKCKLYSQNYSMTLENGKSFLFNSSFENYEINESNYDRIVLEIEFDLIT